MRGEAEMKKLNIIVALALVLGFASMAYALNPHDTSPRFLAYVPTDRMPTLDATLDEYGWVPSQFIYKASDWVGGDAASGPRTLFGTGTPDWEDYDVPFCFLGYNLDADVLILAVQVVDDIGYGFDWSWGDSWRGVDMAYWYLDADADGGQYQYGEGLNSEEAQQMYCRFDLYEDGVTSSLFTYTSGGENGGWAYKEPYTHVAYNWDRTTGSYTLELTMQLWDWMAREVDGGAGESTPHTFEEGQTIGMRLTFLDVDSDADDDWAAFTFNGPNPDGIDNGFYADNFDPWLCLTAEQMAAEPTTWGQLKSLFR